MADFDDYIDAFRDTGTPARLAECSSCGRTFNATAIARHAKVCQGQKKRKPFDSSKQRNSDLPKDFVKKPTKSQSELTAGVKKSNWREKHEEFINNLRAARGVASAQKTGGPLPPPPPPAANPDYVQCPHCSRRFNEHAAERHMPFCKEQKSRLASTSSAKSGSLAKRTQYKPPLPGKKTSTGSATPTSSAGKTRQVASAKTKSDLDFSSPGQSSGYGSRQPLASPSSRRKQVPNASPMSARKGRGSPSQQRSKQLNGTFSGRVRSSERNQHLFDSEEEVSPATQTREARYGRRSSQSNGNTDNPGGRGGSGSR
ncbi:Zinc finger C2HC domain-containing protein 1A [Stylophora pistillata]|uniref:Zinc finger C2HC domain-containing protein 1A n=2 Tax=Stylophora pistillata TaxID=50429 RepID=A0A2B4RVU2_STYPI|nr:Zinc finger C2HC domain-containing protein 1A [Stylophora pistillata]